MFQVPGEKKVFSKHIACVGRSQKWSLLPPDRLGGAPLSHITSVYRLRNTLHLTVSWPLSAATFNGINGQEHQLEQIFGYAGMPACHIFRGTQIKSLFVFSICYKWN